MSALPPKADIAKRSWDVRFVPKADISHLFDHLVGLLFTRQAIAPAAPRNQTRWISAFSLAAMRLITASICIAMPPRL
jgi:hypothetical protein